MIKVEYEITKNNGYIFTLLNNTISISEPKRVFELQSKESYEENLRYVPSSYIRDKYTIEINGKYRNDDYAIGRGSINRGFKKANSIASAKKKDKSTDEIVSIITSSKYNDKAKYFLQDNKYYIYEKEEMHEQPMSKLEEAIHVVFNYFESYTKAKEYGNFVEAESLDYFASEYGFKKVSSLLNHVKFLQDTYGAFNSFSESYEEDIYEICSQGSSEVLKEYMEIENVTK